MTNVKDKLIEKPTNPEEKKPKNMLEWVNTLKPEIAKALPSVITPDRFTRMAMTAISTNSQLANSTPRSFIGALLNAAQLGLEPNTLLGQAYLIPFKNGKTGEIETQFQIGYKGLIDLAHRSGEFQMIYAKEVFENDEFDFEFGLEPKLSHKPTLGERGKVVYYYAVFRLTNGGYGFDVMSVEDVQTHMKKFSQAANKGFSPWQTNFDEMAKKTVLKKVLKYAPIKTEFVKVVTTDETIKSDITKDMGDVPNKDIFDGTYEPLNADENANAVADESEKTS